MFIELVNFSMVFMIDTVLEQLLEFSKHWKQGFSQKFGFVACFIIELISSTENFNRMLGLNSDDLNISAILLQKFC